MTIEKYLHSCLVFEKEGFRLLFDPGTFSFAEHIVTPQMFASVSAIIITHNHPDHLDPENLRQIVKLSGATIYTNEEVAEALKKEGLESTPVTLGVMSIGPFALDCMTVAHEPLLDSPLPQMNAYIIDGKILNPGDSFEDALLQYRNMELLLLPVMAPFTTEIQVAAFADKLKPKRILPIHDGYAKNFFLKQRYENYEKHFSKNDIEFLKPLNIGERIDLN